MEACDGWVAWNGEWNGMDAMSLPRGVNMPRYGNHSSAPISHPIPLCKALDACVETSSRPNDGHPASSPRGWPWLSPSDWPGCVGERLLEKGNLEATRLKVSAMAAPSAITSLDAGRCMFCSLDARDGGRATPG